MAPGENGGEDMIIIACTDDNQGMLFIKNMADGHEKRIENGFLHRIIKTGLQWKYKSKHGKPDK